MKKLITITTLALLVTITLMSQLGCSKETETPTSESNRWLELLSVLPANENTLKAAYLQDFACLAEKVDKQTTPEYVISRQHHLSGYTGWVVVGKELPADEEWKQTLGFTMADVDQTIYAGALPLHYYEAVRGRFSRDDVDNAARTGPGNDILEIVSYQGHEFYSWGEDHGINFALRSNVRPLGKGFRLALIDDFIFWVSWTDGIKEMIDSYEDNIDSLADIENYQLLAQGLEELDVCCTFFSAESQSLSHVREVYKDMLEGPSNERQQLFVEEFERQVRLKPYQALATGAGIDEKGYYMAIVLLNSSEEVAQENATLLEQRINQAKMAWGGQKWSDLIESMEIESKGQLTLARLYGESCGYWDNFEMLGEGPYEPLLMYE